MVRSTNHLAVLLKMRGWLGGAHVEWLVWSCVRVIDTVELGVSDPVG